MLALALMLPRPDAARPWRECGSWGLWSVRTRQEPFNAHCLSGV